MVVTNEPIDDLVREMYARFGLAYYSSEVLHRGLCIILAMSDGAVLWVRPGKLPKTFQWGIRRKLRGGYEKAAVQEN